jgi:hypothetical protein
LPYSYSAFVQASLSTNTDNLIIEVTAPANVTIRIKKIRITHDDGTGTTSADYYRKVKTITESVAGTGGSTFTPISQDQNGRAAGSTVKTGLTAVGTIDQTINNLSIHSTTDYFWQATDEDDYIVIKPGGIFGIVVNPAH